MLKLAAENIKVAFPDVEIKPVRLDFELGNFAEETYKLREGGFQNLMLFWEVHSATNRIAPVFLQILEIP